MFKKILLGLLVAAVTIYFWNAGWRVAPPPGTLELIAHRGVHQNFDSTGLGNDGCSATRIDSPTNEYLENTLPSMQAAFDAGADIIEFDVHPTTDGQFAVMHDWTIDCRTEGVGETRSHDMTYLKTLDIGYGYTADGGKTFPFRGKGVGMMPEIYEVLDAFPGGKFLVNFKSREAREGDMLADLLKSRPAWRNEIWGAYGGDEPSFRAQELIGDLNVWSRKSMIDCILNYAGLGWTGMVPGPCQNTIVMMPVNVAPFLWGWPNLLLQRFKDAGSEIILLGPFEPGDPGTNGIDTLEELAQVPAGFTGYLWTNKIEIIGPAVTER